MVVGKLGIVRPEEEGNRNDGAEQQKPKGCSVPTVRSLREEIHRVTPMLLVTNRETLPPRPGLSSAHIDVRIVTPLDDMQAEA
jgi:hypothetical protein